MTEQTAGEQLEVHDTYERTESMAVSPDELFAYLSEPANTPDYLPPIREARMTGEEELHLEGTSPDGDFASEGYFRVYPEERRMEWGAEVSRRYSGWMIVRESGEQSCMLTVHLEFGPRSVEPDIQQRSGPDEDPLEESLTNTIMTIREKVGGRGGTAPGR